MYVHNLPFKDSRDSGIRAANRLLEKKAIPSFKIRTDRSI